MVTCAHSWSLISTFKPYQLWFAVFKEQPNNLSHFEGFCVLIVELCPSPTYRCLSKPESWFCDRYGFSHSVQVRLFLPFSSFLYFRFLVLDKLFHWINVCKPWSHDLGKQGTLQTFNLNYFAWPPRKAGKTDTNFLTCEKNQDSSSPFIWYMQI